MKRTTITESLTTYIADRFAKVAATYTEGACRVVYDDKVERVGSVLHLPVRCKDEQDDDVAWGFLNIESGHADTYTRLRSKKSPLRTSPELFDQLSPRLKELLPGPKETPLNPKMLKECIREVCTVLTSRLVLLGIELKPEHVAAQHSALMTAFESVRVEESVRNKWSGTVSHIDAVREEAFARWLQTRPKDFFDFEEFTLALQLHLYDAERFSSFGGDQTRQAISQVKTVIDLFRVEASLECDGWFDSVIAAFAVLEHVIDLEEPPEQDGKSDDDDPESNEGDEGNGDGGGTVLAGETATQDGQAEQLAVGTIIVINATGQTARVVKARSDGRYEVEDAIGA